VYSTSDQKWRTYGDFSQIHATAISGDGSTVASIADEADSDTRGLLLLDVGNGQITKVAKIVAVTVSWSPDGRELVLGTPGGDIPPQIKIFDINSRSTRELAEGNWPSWSPSGDWIAYFDHSNEKVHLVHPDGTGNRILKNVGGSLLAYRAFGGEPVWSPDEKKLLLNEYKGEGNFIGVVLLDIDTRLTGLGNRCWSYLTNRLDRMYPRNRSCMYVLSAHQPPKTTIQTGIVISMTRILRSFKVKNPLW
jgi:Tol biopolymer transport system component